MSEDVLDEGLEPRGEEGRFAGTWQNKAAGRALRAGRGDAKQSEFAAALSRELGLSISTTALSGWETGRRQVPTPVLLAVAKIAERSLDALMAESGAPEVVTWAEGLGLPQRMDSQAADIAALRAELAELRQRYAAFQAEVIETFTRAGLPYSPRSSRPMGRASADAGPERRTAG